MIVAAVFTSDPLPGVAVDRYGYAVSVTTGRAWVRLLFVSSDSATAFPLSAVTVRLWLPACAVQFRLNWTVPPTPTTGFTVCVPMLVPSTLKATVKASTPGPVPLFFTVAVIVTAWPPVKPVAGSVLTLSTR